MSSFRQLAWEREWHQLPREKLQSLPPEQIRPQLLINGDDLIQAGYQPGPQFKEWLTAVEDAQLEGTISTREEALELVKSLKEEGIDPAESIA